MHAFLRRHLPGGYFVLAATAVLGLSLAATAFRAEALTLTGFTPGGGPGGTVVTLTGSGFNSATTVKFNGIAAASFTINTDSQIVATVPGSATTGPISISDGSNTAASSSNFFVGYVPGLNSFSPTGGPAGTIVTINGSYFSAVSSVNFNGVSASFTVNSSTQIVATVPAGASTGNVSVTNPAGTGSMGTYYFPPTISGFAPAGGVANTPVHIDGNNFAVVNTVYFNGVSASFQLQDNNHILAYVPGSASTGPVSVVSFAGTATSPGGFFVGPAPAVATVAPAGGPAGTPVTITGTDFVNITGVSFNGISAPFTVTNATTIHATVPGAATSGPVAVSNPAGTGTWSQSFYVGNAPVVGGFLPASGPVGTSVTLSGTGFVSATDVRFNGTSANFVANSDAQIVATVPVGATTGTIAVVNPSGTGVSAGSFSVAPKIVSFTPTTVAASSATSTNVTISGYNFTSATEVRFNGVLAAMSVTDDHTISAWVPSGATTGPITVATAYGIATSPFAFEIVVFTPPAHSPFATWPLAPWQNVPIVTASGDQYGQVVCADSTGGAYIAWQDNRSGTGDIYLQRVTAYGDIAPGWPVGGMVVCDAGDQQQNPQVVADQVGGVIVTWMDYRSGSWDIYAERIGPNANLAIGWSVNGDVVSNALSDQTTPTICSDGASGAFVAWQDYRAGQWDIYVSRVLSNGTRGASWDPNGLWVSNWNYHDLSPTLMPDGSGGAYVGWNDNRNYPFLSRVTGSGLIAGGWPAGGLLVSSNPVNNPVVLASDRQGNVFVAWANSYGYPYAMKFLADGSPAPGWSGGAHNLSNNYYYLGRIDVVPDGQDGLIAAWEYNSTLLAQHVTSTGAVAPGWAAAGNYLRSTSQSTGGTHLSPDGYGGAIATWFDNRNGDNDIYAQRILSTGTIASGWPATGVTVSSASNGQIYPVIVPSPLAGAIIAWVDYRNSSVPDIYAQNVGLSGKPGNLEPHITSVKDVTSDQGGKLRITWQATPLDTLPTMEISTYGVWRRVSSAAAAASMRHGAAMFSAANAEVRPGVLRLERANAQDVWWEGLGSIPARGQLAYSFVASTLADSMAGAPATETYMVDAHATFGPYFWSAAPDSGRSVDNLPPGTPHSVVATYLPGSVQLHWTAVSDRDLQSYRIYRGSLSDFVPSEATLVGTTSDTAFVDANASEALYKIVAVDIHGNTGIAAISAPPSQAGVEDALPTRFELTAPSPNPAMVALHMSMRMPRESSLEWAVFDAAGRRVRHEDARMLPAGEHQLGWDLRDDAGRPVGHGLYFVRAKTGGGVFQQRVVVLR